MRVGMVDGVPGFVLGGRPFNFVGANAYYLQEDAARELKSAGAAAAVVEEALGKMSSLGITVVRAWAFNDDPAKDTVIQRAPLVYDEANLVGLDSAIARAGAHGVRLILPLVNYWNAYGGAQQYVTWHGLPNAVEGDTRFFTDPAVRAHFLQHVEHILKRVNTITHVEYRNDPTIFGWELMNEVRGRGLGDDGTTLASWVEDVASTIKRIDTNHLVTTGEEGFDSTTTGYDGTYWASVGDWVLRESESFSRNLASPSIDFASAHLYPEQWGWPADRAEEAGRRWIVEHTRLAKSLGKPMVLGEFGLQNKEVVGHGAFDLATRRHVYSTWMNAALMEHTAGVMAWLFAYDSRPDTWDDHTFYWKNGTNVADPQNRYADLIREFASKRPAP